MRVKPFTQIADVLLPLHAQAGALAHARIPKGAKRARALGRVQGNVNAIVHDARKAVRKLNGDAHSPAAVESFSAVVDALDGAKLSQTYARKMGKELSAATANLITGEAAYAVNQIAAKADNTITASDLKNIVAVIELPSGIREQYPQATALAKTLRAGELPKNDEDTLDVIEAVRRSEIARGIVSSPTTTPELVRQQFAAILAKPNHELELGDLRTLAAIESLPRALKVGVPETGGSLAEIHYNKELPGASNDVGYEINRVRLDAEIQKLTADPHSTPAALLSRVEQILDRPSEQITSDDLRTLAAIEQLPSGLRPQLMTAKVGDSQAWRMEELYLWQQLPTDGQVGAGVIHDLRSEMKQARYLRNPQNNAESTAKLYADILAKPDSQFTRDDAQMIAIIHSLPDRYKTKLHPVLKKSASVDLLPYTPSYVEKQVAHIRLEYNQRAFDARPGLTPESLLQEYKAILAKEDEQITRDDLMVLALIENAPESLRSRLPIMNMFKDFPFVSSEGMYIHRYFPTDSLEALQAFTHLRDVLLDGGHAGTDRIAESVAKVHNLSPALLQMLEIPGMHAMAVLPLPPESRLAINLQRVEAALAPAEGDDVLMAADSAVRMIAALTTARSDVAALMGGDALTAGIAHKLDGLLEGNIQRIQGSNKDGFSYHPDYAELGKIRALGSLLATHVERGAEVGVPAAHVAPQLTW